MIWCLVPCRYSLTLFSRKSVQSHKRVGCSMNYLVSIYHHFSFLQYRHFFLFYCCYFAIFSNVQNINCFSVYWRISSCVTSHLNVLWFIAFFFLKRKKKCFPGNVSYYSFFFKNKCDDGNDCVAVSTRQRRHKHTYGHRNDGGTAWYSNQINMKLMK